MWVIVVLFAAKSQEPIIATMDDRSCDGSPYPSRSPRTLERVWSSQSTRQGEKLVGRASTRHAIYFLWRPAHETDKTPQGEHRERRNEEDEEKQSERGSKIPRKIAVFSGLAFGLARAFGTASLQHSHGVVGHRNHLKPNTWCRSVRPTGNARTWSQATQGNAWS